MTPIPHGHRWSAPDAAPNRTLYTRVTRRRWVLIRRGVRPVACAADRGRLGERAAARPDPVRARAHREHLPGAAARGRRRRRALLPWEVGERGRQLAHLDLVGLPRGLAHAGVIPSARAGVVERE